METKTIIFIHGQSLPLLLSIISELEFLPAVHDCIKQGLDLQRGLFAQYSLWKLTAGVHYFNPFANEGFVITTLAIGF